MKTMKTTLMIAAITLISYAAMATGNLSVNIVQAERDRAIVEIDNLKIGHFEIEVTDNTGDILFYKKTKDEAMNYKRKYDFSVLDNGEYTLRVKFDNELNENKFRLENGNIEVLDSKKVVAPFFAFEDKALKMSYLNFENEQVGLYVYNDNELLYEKSLGTNFTINQGLDFSKLEPGNYTVVLATGMEWFDHEVKLD